MSQQALDRDALVMRLRERLGRGTLTATDSLLAELSPTVGLALLTDALRSDGKEVGKTAGFVFPIGLFWLLFITIQILGRFSPEGAVGVFIVAVIVLLMRYNVFPVFSALRRLKRAQGIVAMVASGVQTASSLPDLIDLAQWFGMVGVSGSGALGEVERAIRRVLPRCTSPDVAALTAVQRAYLVALAQRATDSKQKTEILLVLASVRAPETAGLAKLLLEPTQPQGVRTIAEEVLRDIEGEHL